MKKMKIEFGQLHQFLEEQEKLLMAQMEEVKKEIARKREEHLVRLSEKLSSLEGFMREMEAKRQEPSSDFLKVRLAGAEQTTIQGKAGSRILLWLPPTKQIKGPSLSQL